MPYSQLQYQLRQWPQPLLINGVVTDTYKTVIKQIPYRVEVCQDRVQPAGDGSATNELVGALFGGAIGNQFGEW